MNGGIINGTLSFREGFDTMLRSVAAFKSFNECRDLVVANIKLDPGFKTFYDWCRTHDVPIVILSSGMEPLIRALLEKLLGEGSTHNIPIISNDVVGDKSQTGWKIVFHDGSHFGHDKSLAIQEYRAARDQLPEHERPAFFYCGDGVSDLSAARETDLLFAKAGHGMSPPPSLLENRF